MFVLPDVRPHWSVDFWVSDTDSVSARAWELGGTVVTPPADNAGFRSSVIADPHGAVFSVSQLLVPPLH
jgi:predicted enzyme related to lactoylglutathione lyase